MKSWKKYLRAFASYLQHMAAEGATECDHRWVFEKNGIGIEGFLEVFLFGQGGEVLDWRGANLVLNQGKAELIALIVDDPAREVGGVVRSVSRIAMGDGGATGAAYNVPKSRSATATGLFYEIHRRDLDSVSAPAVNKRTFLSDVNSADLNVADFNPVMGGYYLNEAALVSSLPGTYTDGAPGTPGVVGPSDVLITHTTFPSLPFDPALALASSFRWTLTYLF